MTVLLRPRIQALLADSWARRLTLVTAGGGYGKTTELLALAERGAVRWLGLRPVDREVELLAARLAEALDLRTVPGVAVPAASIGADDRARPRRGTSRRPVRGDRPSRQGRPAHRRRSRAAAG